MSFFRVCVPRPPFARILHPTYRCYASKATPSITQSPAQADAPKSEAVDPESESRSSCPPNTLLVGVNYLKGQPTVLALADDEYPPWLWTLLQPKVLPDDGPGGVAEKVRLRRENRQRIKDQNFMKTQ